MEDKPHNILLSICIPTYNRAIFLAGAIKSVLNQVTMQNQAELEIVISDNASMDNTAQIVEQLRQKAKIPVIYKKNTVNLGPDRNFLQVVEMASGQYAWILGDDDELAPGAIDQILGQIKQQPDVDLFMGERKDLDFSLTRAFRQRPILRIATERIFDFQREKINTYLAVVRRLPGIFSYLSNLVFLRQKWLDAPQKGRFIGTNYIHIYLFMYLVWGGAKGRLQYLPEQIIYTRWGNDQSLSVGDLFTRIKMDAESFHQAAEAVLLDKSELRQIDSLLLKNDLFSWIVRARIKGGRDFWAKTLPYLFARYKSQPLFWLKVVPLLFVPSIFLKILRWVYRCLVKQEPLGWDAIWNE